MDTLETLRKFSSIKRNQEIENRNRIWRKGCLTDASVVKEVTWFKKKKRKKEKITAEPHWYSLTQRDNVPGEAHLYLFQNLREQMNCQKSPKWKYHWTVLTLCLHTAQNAKNRDSVPTVRQEVVLFPATTVLDDSYLPNLTRQLDH